jgi:hypothetical protein
MFSFLFSRESAVANSIQDRNACPYAVSPRIAIRQESHGLPACKNFAEHWRRLILGQQRRHGFTLRMMMVRSARYGSAIGAVRACQSNALLHRSHEPTVRELGNMIDGVAKLSFTGPQAPTRPSIGRIEVEPR